MLTESIHFVFAGGGKPGHYFPGLAVAQQLRRMSPQVTVTFLGLGNHFERKSAQQGGFDYVAMRGVPLRAVGVWRMLVGGQTPVCAARTLLKQRAPSVVIGMGGEGSVPALCAAMSLELPIALLEQNTTATPITRRFAPYASLICTAGDENHDAARRRGPGACGGRGDPQRIHMPVLRAQRKWTRRVVTPTSSSRTHGRRSRATLECGGSQGALQIGTRIARLGNRASKRQLRCGRHRTPVPKTRHRSSRRAICRRSGESVARDRPHDRPCQRRVTGGAGRRRSSRGARDFGWRRLRTNSKQMPTTMWNTAAAKQ